jgi:hypothetical protein
MKQSSISPRVYLAVTGFATMAAVLTGCGGTPDLTGNWTPDDGTGTKVISKSGACEGMFYSGTKPLDIGGGMSCSLSDKKNPQDRYSLVVSQPPNRASYEVQFNGEDDATVFDSSGTRLYSMKRL